MAEFIYPTDLPVSSPFGPRSGGFHPGIDFSDGVEGHPIHAIADGIVTYAAYEAGGLGNTVTITHDWRADQIKSGYGHMRDRATVDVGDRVRQGDTIGFVGTTGASTGPHLHLWMGQNPNTLAVDPAPFLEAAPPEDDDMTPDQAKKLDDVHAVLVDGVLGAPSLYKMAQDLHAVVVTGFVDPVLGKVTGLYGRIEKLVKGT